MVLQFQLASWSHEYEPKVWSRPFLRIRFILKMERRKNRTYSLLVSRTMTSEEWMAVTSSFMCSVGPLVFRLWGLANNERLLDNPLQVIPALFAGLADILPRNVFQLFVTSYTTNRGRLIRVLCRCQGLYAFINRFLFFCFSIFQNTGLKMRYFVFWCHVNRTSFQLIHFEIFQCL